MSVEFVKWLNTNCSRLKSIIYSNNIEDKVDFRIVRNFIVADKAPYAFDTEVCYGERFVILKDIWLSGNFLGTFAVIWAIFSIYHEETGNNFEALLNNLLQETYNNINAKVGSQSRIINKTYNYQKFSYELVFANGSRKIARNKSDFGNTKYNSEFFPDYLQFIIDKRKDRQIKINKLLDDAN